MREIIIHFGILMSVLAVISGVWENHTFELIIFKAIGVFVIWTCGSRLVHYLVKHIFKIAPQNESQKSQ